MAIYLTAHPEAAAATAPDAGFLAALGRRVRQLREQRGMTRKRVAQESAVSERHLAHLEAGQGNLSVLLLRRVAMTLGTSLSALFEADDPEADPRHAVRQLLDAVPPERVPALLQHLRREFGAVDAGRRERIALIGLRGAGKSTLGQRLAAETGVPFVEVDHEIERDAGMPLAEIFLLGGQAGYRRSERRTLERVLHEHSRAVLSVGGGIVSQAETYELLLAHCYTVWLKAAPEEHMARVVAQGDLRPMAGNSEAMEDLRRILAAREPLYRRADATVDTGGRSVDDSLAQLRRIAIG